MQPLVESRVHLQERSCEKFDEVACEASHIGSEELACKGPSLVLSSASFTFDAALGGV